MESSLPDLIGNTRSKIVNYQPVRQPIEVDLRPTKGNLSIAETIKNAHHTADRKFLDVGSSSLLPEELLEPDDMVLKGATLKQMRKAHADNGLTGNQCASAKGFMKKVMYQIPLRKLYQVVASCQYEEESDFCPVLVKINDETILKGNDSMPFLLQVWTING